MKRAKAGSILQVRFDQLAIVVTFSEILDFRSARYLEIIRSQR